MRLRYLIFVIFLLLAGIKAMATHMSGGEIYWECVGPNTYQIKLVVYRDCAGIDVDPSYNLQLTSPCGNRSLTVTTPGGVEISQLCDLQLPNSTCNGGTLPGIEQYIYTGTIVLPPCNSWSIRWTNIYRNNAIANLMNPGTQEMFIEAVMNNAIAPCNDSPVFTNTAIPYVCLGYPVTFSYGAFDPEADSLSYALIGARKAGGNAIPYVAPNTPATPIPGITLNPATGLISFTLNTAGNWVVVVRVTQYNAAGQVIGTIIRDMQFVAYPCDNIPPDAATGVVTNLTGSAVQTGPRAVEVCESGNFCFDMVISDVNAANVLDAFSNIQQNLPGATFTFSGTNPITVQVCWTALPSTSGFFPFIVNVNDGACPIPAFQTYVYSVNVLPGVTASLEVVDETCLGAGNGSLSAIVSAGTDPYIYSWSNGSTESMINAGPGDYDLTISDANGCVSHVLTGTIGTAAMPNEADAGADLTMCSDELPIQLSGTVVNATSGSWSGGTGTYNGTGLSPIYTPSADDILAGSVQLTLTTIGNDGCPPATDVVEITLPNNFSTASVSTVDATCFDLSNGSASFTPADPGFTYLWNDPLAQTTATATGLGEGTYSVTVTDAEGCSITLPATIGPNAPLSVAEIVTTDETCSGTGDGTATVDVTGGTAPYTYEWSNGSPNPGITATAGNYMVQITDANGCAPVQAQATINAAAQPNEVTAGDDQVVCIDAMPIQLNGSITNATGATWSGGTGQFTGTGASVTYSPSQDEMDNGSVSLTITTTGNTGCPPASDAISIQITNSFVDGAVSVIDATCSDVLNGSAAFSPELPGFTYSWDDPSAQTTATATGLGAGTVNVTVTDQYGCTITLPAVIGPVAPISISEITSTDETCLDAGNGTASVTVTGGTAPYQYLWSNGATTASITATSGAYSVSITDANNCSSVNDVVTIGAAAQPNAADAGADQVVCMDALTVDLSATVTNATTGVWSGGSGTFTGTGTNVQYEPSQDDITAGEVILLFTTTDNTGCPAAQDTMSVLIPNSFGIGELTVTDATCNELSNGSASYTISDPGFQYAWSDPLGQTTPDATDLSAGNYTLTVTDIHGCTITLPFEIGPPAPVTITEITSIDETCLNNGNGSATVSVSGGTAPYTYLWNTGNTTPSISGTSGDYSVSITDANGCAPALGNVTIGAAAMPNAVDAGADQVVCMDDLPVQLNGVLTNAPDGIWSGGSEIFNGTGPVLEYVPSQTDINAGSVTLTLTTVGNTGCPPASDELVILIPNSFANGVVNTVDATCSDATNGAASFAPDLPGFTYQWDVFSATTSNVTGLGAGTYNVTVTDSFGCTITLPAVIGPPDAISITEITSTDETCLWAGNGSASVSVTGGTAPYTYTWSNGGTTPTIAGTSGTYSISVTDANGCAPATGEIEIAPAALPNEAMAGADQIACMDDLMLELNGSVVNATSGTWSGGTGAFIGSGTNVIYEVSMDDVTAGSVTLTLTTTGNDGCPAAADQLVIDIPNSFANGAITAVDATCYEVSNGSASFTPADPQFTYAWNDVGSQTTATATGLAAGQYQLTVTDNFGCSITLPASIGPASPITIAQLISENENCLGSGDGNASVTVTGGSAPYNYLWSNGGSGSSISAPSGTYTVQISDANGCAPVSGEVVIGTTGLPNVANAGNDVIACMNDYPVQLQGTVTNATSGTWSGGSGALNSNGTAAEYFPTINEIIAGGVDLTFTTTGNETCPAATDTVHLTFANAFMNAAITATNSNCNGSADGALSFSPADANFSYVWNVPGAPAGPIAAGLSAGEYSITVTDALGCDSTFTGVITEPDTLVIAAVNTTDVICNAGSNGQASLVINGGTMPYTATWSTGANGLMAVGLQAGEYSVEVSDQNGCTTTTTATIDQPGPITFQPQIPDTVCVNAPVLLTAQAQGGNGNYQFNWSGLGTGDSITVEFPASQFVFLTVTDSAGCTAPSQMELVNVLDLSLADFTVYGNTTVCAGQPVTVGADVDGYSGNYMISWPELPGFGEGPFTFPLNESVNMPVILTNSCGDSQNETITLLVDVPPAVQLPPIIAQGCAPLTVQFPNLPLGNVTWSWDLGNGQTSNAASPLVVYAEGEYTATLTVTTPFGCSSSGSASGQIIADDSPVAAFTASTNLTDLENAVIGFTNYSTGSIANYSWSFGDGATSGAINPQHNYNDIGSYEVQLTVQSANGCAATATDIIQITPVYDITVPNAFSPSTGGGNGGNYNPNDLSNDVFYPFVRFVDDFRMRIFNRWGELVFESNDLNRGWDGYYKGVLSQQDVYVVQTWVRFIDGREIQKLSDLTLFR